MGILSRAQATEAILSGRVRVNGRIETSPSSLIIPERARIHVDGVHRATAGWRALLLHKPRGVLTTRRDPEGRRTVYDVLGGAGRGLNAVGRLDFASSGLLLFTTDTQLANWILDPVNQVPRTYLVNVRGEVVPAQAASLLDGVGGGANRMRAAAVRLLKTSGRESLLRVELREGRNREVRRLFKAIGHEVTRLKRIQFGGLELKQLAPGEWRELGRSELRKAFPGAPI
jgi:23S rRNA pseudouridine2605 synthase